MQKSYIDRILEVMRGSRKSVCTSNEFVQMYSMIGKLNDVGQLNSQKVLAYYKNVLESYSVELIVQVLNQKEQGNILKAFT